MKVEAYEEERSPEMEELLTQFDFSKMDQSLSELFPEEKLRFQDVLDLVLSGEQELSGSLVNRLIKDQVGYAYRSCRDNLIHILVIALVAAVFHQLAGALKSTQIAEIGFYVLYLLLVALFFEFLWRCGGMGSGKSGRSDRVHGSVLSALFSGSYHCEGKRDIRGLLSDRTVLDFPGRSADRKDSAAVDSCLYDDEHSESFIK